MVLAVFSVLVAPRRGWWPLLVGLAVGAGWWLAGAPRDVAGLMAVAILLGGLVAGHGLAGFFLGRAALLIGATGFVLALWVCQAPPVWLLMGMAPWLAALALRAGPASERAVLAVAVLLASAMAGALLAAGRLPRGVGAVDLAVMAGVLAVLLAPRLRFARILAGPLAIAVAVGAAWAVWAMALS